MTNNGSDENNKEVKSSQNSSKPDKLVPFYLGPEFDPAKHQLHVDQLILALSDHRNSNIALTGTYGSGKSSILQGLAEQLATKKYKHLEIQPIFISLSSFNLDQSATPEETVNTLQREILKQLLVREDPLKIPKARYRGIPIIPRWRKGVIYALVSILLLTIYGLFSDADAVTRWITGDAVVASGSGLAVGIKIAILFIAVYLTVLTFDFSIAFKPAIKAITVGPGKLEIGDGDEDYFDKYLAEIVYYFKISKVNLVVFEDLDRFESPAIFESLHQLNEQVNVAVATSRKCSASQRTIRFVYAIRDSIFASATEESSKIHEVASQHRWLTTPGENRTKFFDFILPVVPFSTHRNSYEFLYAHLKRAGYADAIDRELINVIGAHVIDHRLLLNIVYEFAIFRQSILADTSDNKLLAMIAYKNTNLSDFEAIARGQSRLDRLTLEFTNFTQTQQAEILKRRLDILEKESLNSELDSEETEASRVLEEYFQQTRGSSIKTLRQFFQHQDSDGLLKNERTELDELIQDHLGRNSLGTALVFHGYLDTDFYLYVSAFTEGLNTARAQKFLVYNVGQIHPDPYYDLDKGSCEEVAKRLAAESFPTLAGAANGNLLLYLASIDTIDGLQPSELITRILHDVTREDAVDSLVAELVGSVVVTEIDSVENKTKTRGHAEDILLQCANILPDVLSDALHAQLEETKAVFVLNVILSGPSKNKISISPKFQETIKDNYSKLPVLSSEEANAQATERAVARIADEMHFLTELKPLNATASFEFMRNGMVDITPENLKMLTESLEVDTSLASLAKYPALLGTVADNPGSYVQALEDLDLKSVTAENIDTMSSKAVPLLCDHLFNTKNNAEDEESQEDQVTNALTTLFSASSSNARLEDLETTDPRAYRALIRAELVCPSPTNAWTYFNSVGQEIDPELKNFLAEVANHKHAPSNETLSSAELLELAKAIMHPAQWEDGEHQRERILKALGEYQDTLEWTDLGELTAEKIHTAIQICIVATDIVSFQSLSQAVPESNRDELLTVFLAEAPIEPDTFDASHFRTLDRFGFLIKNTKINTDLRAKLVEWLCDGVLSADLDDEEVEAILEFSNRTEKSLSSEFVLELVDAYSSSKNNIGFHEMITEAVLLLTPDSLDEDFFENLFIGLGGDFERLLKKYGGSLEFRDYPGLWDLLDLAKEHLQIISSFKLLEHKEAVRVSRRSKR